MNSKIFVLICSIFFMTACDAIKNLTKSKQNEVQTQETSAPTDQQGTSADVCANGESPKIISGTCGGVWRFEKVGTTQSCNFEWGPKVECPEGQAPLSGHAAECYGTTVKSVTSADKITNATECGHKFGAVAAEINYAMKCCPK